jgi:hypothetical protein
LIERKTVEEGSLDERKELDARTEQVITDEALRYRIRKLIEEPKPTSRLKGVLKHPLFLLMVGFLFTTILGTTFTNCYNSKQAELEHQRSASQKELERERSFADELNKIRVSKIGEVWEKVDVFEAGVKEVMQKISVAHQESDNSPKRQITIRDPIDKDLQESGRLRKELLALLEKNRFWLGEHLYGEIKSYTDNTYNFFLAWRAGKNTKEDDEKRRQERIEIIEIRDKMLKGEI